MNSTRTITSRFVLLSLGVLLALSGMGAGLTVAAVQPVPTLVPPTLVPTTDAGATDALLGESALARVQSSGEVRVGLLYNAPPFGELNVRGEVSGYDADLARALADAWGVKFVPVQVTRQTALSLLKAGDVDMLLAAQTHRRDLDFEVEFSHTYVQNSQSMLVRQDDGAAGLGDMANRKVGYVLGSPAGEAISLWQQRTGITLTVTPYLTLDQVVTALVASEIDGVVEDRVHLLRFTQQPIAKILDEPVAPEPYAVVARRQDVNWRNLINKTLQYLTRKGRMQEIQQATLPGTKFLPGLIPVWAGVGDEAPKPAEFPTDVPYPAQYALPRIQAAGVVRVAGLDDLPAEASESQRRWDAVNRAVMEALAARWGVRVEYVPNSAANAADLVATGQADIAVGVPLDWALTDRVDLTAPYLLHGERLMVKKDSDYETFQNLRGRWVAVFGSEAGAADRVNALAESVSSGVRIFTVNNEPNMAQAILDSNSADVAFGDSIKLLAQMQANPDVFRLTTRGSNPDVWYSRVYVGLAVPRNDIDLRLLVEYTLQEIGRSGAWPALLAAVMQPEDMLPADIWPGVATYLNFSLGG